MDFLRRNEVSTRYTVRSGNYISTAQYRYHATASLLIGKHVAVYLSGYFLVSHVLRA